MKLIRELNLFDNKKLILWLNIAAVGLFFFFLWLFFSIAKLRGTSGSGDFSMMTAIVSLLVFYIMIVIHELIHGLFFKVFNPKGKVKFGFKQGMAYATSPNSFYSKGEFSVIALAPFVIINTTLLVLYFLGMVPVFAFVMLSAIHAGSCVGDFYYILLIIQTPPKAFVEDVEQGINFYIQN